MHVMFLNYVYYVCIIMYYYYYVYYICRCSLNELCFSLPKYAELVSTFDRLMLYRNRVVVVSMNTTHVH